jgi:hypothetical protein
MVFRYLFVASVLGAAVVASPAMAQSGDHRASAMSGDARSDAPEMPQAKAPAAVPPSTRQGASTPPPAPMPAATPAIVKVGPHTKPAVARIVSSEMGDRGCYMSIVDDSGVTTQEIADFDLCAPNPPPKGRRLALTWRIERVLAASCQGDVDCKKRDIVPMIVGARPLN